MGDDGDAIREPWVSVDEIAKHLDLAKNTVYRWIESTGSASTPNRSAVEVKLADIDEWVRSGGASDAQEDQ